MSSDQLKIQAYINTGKLKSAYLLAAKKALKTEVKMNLRIVLFQYTWHPNSKISNCFQIERIAEECDKQGNVQIKNFCTKYIQHNR